MTISIGKEYYTAKHWNLLSVEVLGMKCGLQTSIVHVAVQ